MMSLSGKATLICWVTYIAMASTLNNSSVTYNGYSSYTVLPRNRDDLLTLTNISSLPGIDFWTEPSIKHPTTFMLSPEIKEVALNFLKGNDIHYNLTVPDVGGMLKRERKLQKLGQRRRFQSIFSRFLRYYEIKDILNTLAKDSRKRFILENLTDTVEGNSLVMFKMSSDHSAEKPIVMIEAGIHAREWAAPAMAMYLINFIVENNNLMDDVDWYIIPSANPDGYEYSHTTDRLWRKTRSWEPKNGDCKGVDGNRNFDAMWASAGVSNDPCSNNYPGSRPFSERETIAIRDTMYNLRNRLRTYISLHSFGNFILYPYGYSRKLSLNWRKMHQCGRRAADYILENGGEKFTVGNTASVLYPAAGGSDDYVKARFNVPYTYTVELPGGGENGFDLPPNELENMLRVTLPGILTLAQCDPEDTWFRK